MRKRFDTVRDAVATVLLIAAVITTPLIVIAQAPSADTEATTGAPSKVIELPVTEPETEPETIPDATETISETISDPVKPAEEASADLSSDTESAEETAPQETYAENPEPPAPVETYIEEYTEQEPPAATYAEPTDEGSLYPPENVSYENPWYFGSCRCTAYCSCPMCCDNFTTHTGTTVTEGRTVAVDPAYIPFGSHLIINGRNTSPRTQAEPSRAGVSIYTLTRMRNASISDFNISTFMSYR